MGRGLVAKRAFAENERVFSIPRKILLNLGTSSLESACLAAEANNPNLARISWSELVDRGWCPLILMMMFENWRAAQVAEPSWGAYFGVMPDAFDTPMFWSPKDIEALDGTDVVEKIGQADAEQDFRECVWPYINQFPEVFVGEKNRDSLEHLKKYYGLDMYHRMGSLILSRSFNVKRDLKHADDDDTDIHSLPTEVGVQRNIPGEVEELEADEAQADAVEEDSSDNDENDSDEDEEEEDVRDISMVPMADMLNSRFGSENTRLFYKREVLEMRCTKSVAIGEQMLNTYGNPPNSDLLRRYGFVDEPNRGDLVELSAELVVQAFVDQVVSASDASPNDVRTLASNRFEWACTELGMDEVFLLSRLSDPEPCVPYGSTMRLSTEQTASSQKKLLSRAASHIPEDLISFARLLCLPETGFAKAQKRGALPRARLDAMEELDLQGVEGHGTTRVLIAIASILLKAIEQRLAQYPTDWEDTAKALKNCSNPPNSPRRMALVVRAGDQTILNEHVKVLALYSAEAAQEHMPRKELAKKARFS
ncbi:Ribosomal lysine N-methyltransferase 4 [Malassezia yamatoensis]|uniref:Ribosomal lysine N-methyltransferase 4 n=1 Tax=Malassezia yamatoensis TaxID=253288 RepID=A0AAJ6CGK1_9BASI|nr:Ribosomal lysine N-methyltransferase 4 [Malassezia yamatoensis]